MEEHGAHGEHGEGIHLPDPSVWPLVAGIASLVLGVAIVWWTDNKESSFSGPLLGVAVALLMFSIGGWAYEDGRMKKKAESGPSHAGPREARYTQVITFALADGQFDSARGGSGALTALEQASSGLSDLAGFQDLRVIASPATEGPAQVLVETTWAGRDNLATYEQSRATVLDIINAHEDDVVPGSVQVFDMEVVRDTKDVAFRFSRSGAALAIGAMAVGGLTLALGLSAFQNEAVAGTGGGGDGGGGGFDGTIVAQGTAFRTTSFSVPPATEVTLTFDNRDAGIPHNIVIHNGSSSSDPVLTGCTSGCDPAKNGEVYTPLQPGPATDVFTFTTPGVGDYYFFCIAHATQMNGTMTVADGAPVPGAPAGEAPAEDDEA